MIKKEVMVIHLGWILNIIFQVLIIIPLSQLNRKSSKESRKPKLTDLRGSGGIEENASLAIFLSRELDSTEATLSILKARSGRSGWIIPMIFNPERLTFFEDQY